MIHARFLQALYRPSPTSYGAVVIVVRNNSKMHPVAFEATEAGVANAAELVEVTAQAEAVYATCGVFTAAPAEGRGKAADVSHINALWADIDIAGSAHAAPDGVLCPDIDAGLEWLSGLPTPPSCVVDSGHGLQAWWWLDTPLPAADATPLLRAWGARLSAAAPWKLDAVWNIDRLMRVPGTVNRKLPGTPRPVDVVWMHTTEHDARRLVDELPEVTARAGTSPARERPAPDSAFDLEQWFAERHDAASVLTSVGFHSPRPSGRNTEEWLRADATWADHPHPSAEILSDGRCVVYTATLPAGATDQHLGQPRRPYELWVDLVHGGDWSAAASDAAKQRKLADVKQRVKQSMRQDAVVAHAADGWPLNDRGNAHRLVRDDVAGRYLAWVPTVGWMCYRSDTGLWMQDRTGALADGTARLLQPYLQAQADTETDKDRAQALTKWAHTSGMAQRMAAAVRYARDMVQADLDQFDAMPAHVATPEGLVDLRTLEISELTPEHRMTRATAASWRPGAEQKLWTDWIAEMQPDPTVRSYLQLLGGMALLGSNPHSLFVVFHGPGANGKSTLVEVWRRVLGTLAAPLDKQVILTSGGEHAGHPVNVATLRARRFVYVNELQPGANLNGERAKELASQEPLYARQMYGDPFDMAPQFLPVLVCNTLPHLTSIDDGVVRRLAVVPWEQVVPADRRDPWLAEKMATQAGEGVLQWMAQGAQRVLHGAGQEQPAVLLEARREWIAEDDVLGTAAEHAGLQFTGRDTKASRTEVVDALVRAVRTLRPDSGEASGQAVGRWLRSRGVVLDASRRYYRGVTLAKVVTEGWGDR